MKLRRYGLLVLALLWWMTALAQEAETAPTTAFGEAGIDGYEALPEGTASGAITVSSAVAEGQRLRANLTGPNGFARSLDLAATTEVDGLTPGLYSLAATGAGLQLVELTVEVRAGQRALVRLSPVPAAESGAELAQLEPKDPYQVAMEDVETFGPFVVGSLLEINRGEAGGLSVRLNVSRVRLNVTGPDGYRQAVTAQTHELYENDVALGGLAPGVYTVAATAPGYALAEGKVTVRLGEVGELLLELQPLEQADGQQ